MVVRLVASLNPSATVVFFPGDGFSRLDSLVHRRRALWLDQDDTGLGMLLFDRHRRRPKSAHHHRKAQLPHWVGQSFPEFPGVSFPSGDDAGIIKCMDEGQATLALKLMRMIEDARHTRAANSTTFGPIAACGVDLATHRRLSHPHRRRNPSAAALQATAWATSPAETVISPRLFSSAVIPANLFSAPRTLQTRLLQ